MGGGGTKRAVQWGAMVFSLWQLLVYLSVSFVMWDFDAGDWPIEARMIAAFLGMAGLFLAAAFAETA